MKKKEKKPKREIRILGIDDAPFHKQQKECLVVATVFRGGEWMDGLLSTYVEIDGNNATKKIIELIKKSRHYDQLSCIMLKGVALAGFNVVDIQKIFCTTKLPVIIVIRKKPNFHEIEKALSIIKQKEKIEIIRKAGKIFSLFLRGKKIYFQKTGISEEKASEIIKISATRSFIPEPIRIAHIIARGIARGESRGRA